MANISIEKKDLIWSYTGNFLKLTINIILLPLILHFLSDEELGMWYVFSSIGQLIILLDFGFAPALARNIAYVWCGADHLSKVSILKPDSKKTNYEYLKIVLTTCKYIYITISSIALLLLLTCGWSFIHKLSNNNEYLIPWVIYSIGAFLNVLYSYYSSFLIGIGAIAENNKASIFSKVLQIIITFILLYRGYGLTGISIAYLLSGFTLRYSSRYYFLKKKDIKTTINLTIAHKYKKCKDVFLRVWHNASRDGLVTISNYLSTQANTLICSAILGLSTTGSYGLFTQITSIISTISCIPYASVQPLLQEKAIRGEIENSRNIFSTSLMAFVVSFLILFVICILCLPIIHIVKPLIDINYYIIAGLSINVFVYQIYHLSASYISTFNIIPYAKSFILSSILSVTISFILTKYTNIGLWGLIFSPLLVSISYNAWKWPRYALRLMECNLKQSLKIGLTGLRKRIFAFI